MTVKLLKSGVSTLLAAGTLSLGMNLGTPSQAEGLEMFFCSTAADGVPTTYVSTPRGNQLPLIRWEKEWGGGITKEDRCQIVSTKFQKAYTNGNLQYITDGFINGYKVICAASEYGGACSNDILFTLRREDDPKETIQQLFQAGSFAGKPLTQTNGKVRYYYSWEEIVFSLE